MDLSVWSVLGFSLLLGLRHSLDADHVIAVSTIMTRTKSVFKAGMTGAVWGLGHSVMILAVGLLVLFFGISVPQHLELYFEWLVGLLLIYLGLQAIITEYVNKKKSVNESVGVEHFHRRSFFVGMIHGLAGSGALMLLMLTQVSNIGVGFTYLLLFGFGSIVGMFLVAMVIGVPFKAATTNLRLQRLVISIVGLISIGFGISIFI
ncbi:hypothetical protein ACJ2A9_04435 [Anaerobacillus sp. MEB173]|uniref:hypothetical protein n=1 Tax=Anaerobacillus sp. MEB173 TaxID=3383345 RepID=UPI003F939F13